MTDEDKDILIAKLKTEISTLKSIIYKIPGNIYWKNLNNEVLGCNANMAKILKLSSPKEIINKNWIDFLPAELLNEALKNDEKVIETQTELSLEELGINIEGEPAIYVSKKSPFYDDKGRLVGIIGISVDISHQKEIEKKLEIAKKRADEATLAKSRFLAMVSHELRTPLTSILGFANLLNQEEFSIEERNSYINHILYSSNYLLELVDKLLDYSKLEANKLEVQLRSFNLKNLISNIIAMLNSMATEKNITLQLIYNKNIPEVFISDPQILQQIFINLIGNALKFTEKGSVTIMVNAVKKTKKNMLLEIIIKDTGVGISPDKIKYIFKEFYQVDDIYTRRVSMAGTGLGLAIVKKFLKLIKGKIKVKSKIKQGTTFSITAAFPFSTAGQEAEDPPKTTKYISTTNKILLIEDDILVQMVHQKMLNTLGFEVENAENASKALATACDDCCLILVDIGLPDMSGFDLIKELKERTKNQIPIIALTGFFTDEEKQRCYSAGAIDVLIKPVSLDLLKKTISRYIKM